MKWCGRQCWLLLWNIIKYVCVCLWWVTGSVLRWEMSALLNTVLTWTCSAGSTGCGLHGWNALMYTHNTCVSYLVQLERWSWGLWRRSWRSSRSQWCTAVFHTCSRTEDHRPVQRERGRGIGALSSWHDMKLYGHHRKKSLAFFFCLIFL